MSKSAMLRTRRRDVNVKPNRRLDRKSSRGMIYENEELRLRTININAEIERGQSDIKKLRKENEQLRKEIWCLRDEYDKLDRLLKEKHDCTSSSDSETCTSCSESEDPETTQNLENVQKTTLNSLRNDFDHLSVVTEENSAENSENSGVPPPAKEGNWEVLPPDMGYPGGPFLTTQNLHLNGSRTYLPPPTNTPVNNNAPVFGGTLPISQCPRHFFAPLKTSKSVDVLPPLLSTFTCAPPVIPTMTPPLMTSQISLIPIQKTAPDILIQSNPEETSSNSFINGGNLDELLQDIDNISQDILKISSSQSPPFKSEISVVLMPKPMPPIDFDKYQNLKSSLESLDGPPLNINPDPEKCFTPLPDFPTVPETPKIAPTIPPISPISQKSSNPFFYGNFGDEAPTPKTPPKSPQPKRTRKLSIYFKGKKDAPSQKISDSPLLDRKQDSDNQKSSDSKTSNDKKHRKSSSTSPERKHVHIHQDKKQSKKRRKNLNRSLDKFHRDRSFSVQTDRSINLGFDEFLTNSERDRSNSLSSCETVKTLQLPVVGGKIPWFGCWGNGCL